MLSLEEINAEIKKLENKEYFNYDICNKLAILYTIKDHYNQVEQVKTVENIPRNVNLEIVKSVK